MNPGVSRKDFDAVIKENIRLKEALEHIVRTEYGGKDIVIVSVHLTIINKWRQLPRVVQLEMSSEALN